MPNFTPAQTPAQKSAVPVDTNGSTAVPSAEGQYEAPPLPWQRALGGRATPPGLPPEVGGPAAPATLPVKEGEPLGPETRRRMERGFGQDFSGVRVHTDAHADAATKALRAAAFAAGNHLVFSAGRYAPGSAAGRRLIAHELTHVAQGRLAGADSEPADLTVFRSTPHEQEAALAASLVPQDGLAPMLTPRGGIVQLQDEDDDPSSPQPVPVVPVATGPSALQAEVHGLLRMSMSASDRKLFEASPTLVVGSDVSWYDSQGGLVSSFALRPDAKLWGAGWYIASASRAWRLVELNGRRGWVIWTFPPEVARLAEWLTPADKLRLREVLASQHAEAVFVAVTPPGSARGDGDRHSTVAAEHLVNQIRSRLRAGTSGGVDPRVPDRLAVWSNTRGVFVNVWVDGAHEAVAVNDDDTADGLEGSITDAAQRLHDARDPAQSTQVANGAKQTGFVPDAKDPSVTPPLQNARHLANIPAYPADIDPDDSITVTGGTSHFEMKLNYTRAGADMLSQVTARLQPINYYWELFDVTNVKKDERGGISQSAVGSGNHVSVGSGAGRDLGRSMDAISEDTGADVDETFSGSAATWPARANWLMVVGVSNAVRTIGALIGSYLSVVTEPLNGRSIGWSHEGEFLLRCVATPSFEEDAVAIRASSVAVAVVRVENINRRATEANDRTLNLLQRLEAKRDLATGDERTRLDARIAALRHDESASAGEMGSEALKVVNQQLAVAEALVAADEAGVPREQRSPEVRLVAVQLELQQTPALKFLDEVRKQKEEIESRLSLIAGVADRMPNGNYRPHVTLVSEENGQVNDLVVLLGEAGDSREGARHYLLADATASSPRDRYIFEGQSKQPGLAGHAEAVRAAFIDFRENNGYGRGTIAIRLPSTLEAAVGGSLGLDPQMRSAPGAHARAIQRLRDLATAAEVAALFVTGPVGLAIGAVGGIAGAIVAIDSLSRRHEAGALHWDLETIMDISTIVGGVVGVAGIGLQALRNLPRWVSRVERIEGILHIYGVTQLGVSVIMIPVQLESELKQIEDTPGLSEGQRAARRAEAILGAVRSGLFTVMTAKQMLGGGAGKGAGTADPEIEPEGTRRAAPGDPTSDTPPARVPQSSGDPQTEPDEAPKANRPRAGAATPNPRLVELETALGDLQGRVRVVENHELPRGRGRTSARVRYRGGEFQIEVGPGEISEQREAVQAHLETARVLFRYEGPMGRIRQLLSRLLEMVKGTPGYGSEGFEARLEVRKLRRMIDSLEQMRLTVNDRVQSVGNMEGVNASREQENITREIENLESQLSFHEGRVDSLTSGSGFVAAYAEQTLANRPALEPALEGIHSTLGPEGPRTAVIDRVAALEDAGRVKGLDDWIRSVARKAKSAEQVVARLEDLATVEKMSANLKPGEVVELQPNRPLVPKTSADPQGFHGVVIHLDPETGLMKRSLGPLETAKRAGLAPDQQRAFDVWAGGAVARGGDPESLLANMSEQALTSDIKKLQRAFDAWSAELTAKGNDLESVLAKMSEQALIDKIERESRILGEEDRKARHEANLRHPVEPQLAVMGEPDSVDPGVLLNYETKRPSETEVSQARRLRSFKNEIVRLFGDNASGGIHRVDKAGHREPGGGNSYPGIDGSIGTPPRPMQLKGAKPEADPNFARWAANEALTKAQNAGIQHVEVYIEMEGKSRAEIRAGWNVLSAGKEPNGPVFDGSGTIARIEIYCTGDGARMTVQSNGAGGFIFTDL